jgi:hypothetical protein
MKEVYENYLLLSSQKDINVKTVEPFWHRLCMFLASNVGKCPSVVFTSDENKWNKHSEGEHARCFYDEVTYSIVFWAYNYLLDDPRIIEEVPKKIIKYAKDNKYNYIIPLTDIYHEMVHHIQYMMGDWLRDDLLEATAEHSTYMITAQTSDEYIEQSVALWYVARKILKLQNWEFYIFIRDAIVDSNFYKDYFDNKKFIKLLAEEYGGSIDKFFMNMTSKYGKYKLKSQMFRDLKKIHNQLFYKW